MLVFCIYNLNRLCSLNECSIWCPCHIDIYNKVEKYLKDIEVDKNEI